MEKQYRETTPPRNLIAESDYIIIADKPYTASLSPMVAEKIINAQESFNQTKNHFIMIKSFTLPDGNSLLLFQNKKDYIKLGRFSTMLYFRDGMIKVYSQEDGVTISYGSSFTYKGEYYHPLQAQWNVKTIGQETMIAMAQWPDIPLIQKWRLKIINDKEITMNAHTIHPEAVKIENNNFLFALPYQYKKWNTQEKKGEFGRKNILAYADLELPGSTKYLTFQSNKGSSLPDITFLPTSDQSKIIPMIRYKKDSRMVRFTLPSDGYDFSIKLLLSKTIPRQQKLP